MEEPRSAHLLSYNVKEHIFEIQREKRTRGVFMSVFSWNWHLDGDSPRDGTA